MEDINLNHALTPPPSLDSHALIAGLDAAIRIIIKTRSELACGSQALWNKLNHAENHLDRQIAELLGPDAAA